MWGVLAEVATMLDAADCDWRELQQVEGMLSSLSTELERATRVEALHSSTGHRAQEPDVRFLQGSLTWVRTHEYVALESEIHQHLDLALRYAVETLDRLERSQDETQASPRWVAASGDGR